MELLKKDEGGAEDPSLLLCQVCACISRQTDDMEESWEDQIDSYADIPEAMPLQGFEWQTEFALRPFNGESITFIKKMETFAKQFTDTTSKCTGLHVLHTCAYAPQGGASSGKLQAIGFGGR